MDVLCSETSLQDVEPKSEMPPRARLAILKPTFSAPRHSEMMVSFCRSLDHSAVKLDLHLFWYGLVLMFGGSLLEGDG